MPSEWRDGRMTEWSNGKNGGMVEWQEWRDCQMAEWLNGKDGGMADGMAEWQPNGRMVEWRPNGGMVEW
jgi:hypothetical protein